MHQKIKKLPLSPQTIEDLKRQGFQSIIIMGASNPSELSDTGKCYLLASKELVKKERITKNSFHVSIDDPVLIEIYSRMQLYIEVPE